MDATSAMHLDNAAAAATSTRASASGKRKRTGHDEEGEEDEQPLAPFPSHDDDQVQTALPKRLRDRQGQAIGRRGSTLKYNVHDLLNTLAFTRLFVTANFHAYNPSSSPVLIVFVSEEFGEEDGRRIVVWRKSFHLFPFPPSAA